MLHVKKLLTRFAIFATTAFLLLVLILIFGPAAVEDAVFQSIKPAKREAFKKDYYRWKNERLHLPPEALETKPFSPELLAAVRAFGAALKKQALQARQAAHGAQDGILNEAARDRALAELAPLLQSFETMARRPDFELDAGCFANVMDGGTEQDRINGSDILTGARLMRLKAQAAASVGKFGEAMDACEVIVLAARVSPYSPPLSQRIGMTIAEIGIPEWLKTTNQCGNDRTLLRTSQEKQDRLASRLVFLPDPKIQLLVYEAIGNLRILKRAGFDVKLQDQTGRELTIQNELALATDIEKSDLPAAQGDPQTLARIKSEMRNHRLNAAALGGPANGPLAMLARLGSGLMTPSIYHKITPFLFDTATRAQELHAKFEALRHQTSARLAAIPQ